MRRRVTTQVQFTCLERSRRQILRRKFSARTPKGTRSVKISTKGICISVWWDAKAFPAHRSLFYIGGQTSRLNLFSSFLPGWRPTEFPREFSANIRLHPFIRRAIRISRAKRRVNASLFWFVYTIPLWIPNRRRASWKRGT